MFCSRCGASVNDGERFCSNCGAPLQNPEAVQQHSRSGGRGARLQDPYKEQIKDLRLQLKQLRLDLRQVNTSMGRTRAHYSQVRAFLPWRVREGSKWFEDIKLMGKQPQKEQLQSQIADLQQRLLELERAQTAWKRARQPAG